MDSIFHRVSIRKYQLQPVEKEKIEQILRAGMQAPSACNQQPWEFYVVTDHEKIKALAKASPYSACAAGAPVVIVPCSRTSGLAAPELSLVDLSIATENMWIETDSLGLGGVWLAIAPDKERMENVRKVLDLPETLEPFCLFSLGYPAESRPQQDRFDESRIHYVS
ncbi:MAG: nitroreductase family protein [Lachnospiraceae bacterium]|uniref:Nitroreductase family protein n=1 Tax=Candidatus Weimeria bifida TaxID=2599074 RepID=A0A6N7IY70_9FIRM|nr:nitroreductase family protein [Candidatus Weimeria bifida]RRF95660.1 MAG: nitroreductase family protein [Lachnospiraceae bacterium]